MCLCIREYYGYMQCANVYVYASFLGLLIPQWVHLGLSCRRIALCISIVCQLRRKYQLVALERLFIRDTFDLVAMMVGCIDREKDTERVKERKK